MNKIIQSYILGCISSLYFIPEIISLTTSIHIIISGLLIQSLHDAICIYFFILFIQSFQKDKKYLLGLNCLHGLIMILFCFYKRCILTLLYNHIMGIDMCKRYIPIWQRISNIILVSYESEDTCFIENYKNTYLWLNNHILQSSLVLLSNFYHLLVIFKNTPQNFKQTKYYVNMNGTK